MTEKIKIIFKFLEKIQFFYLLQTQHIVSGMLIILRDWLISGRYLQRKAGNQTLISPEHCWITYYIGIQDLSWSLLAITAISSGSHNYIKDSIRCNYLLAVANLVTGGERLLGFLTQLFSGFSRNTKLAKMLPCFAKFSRVSRVSQDQIFAIFAKVIIFAKIAKLD
jgi:hypothetical protein